jgi:hypothetical protein
MKLKLGQLVNAQPALNDLAAKQLLAKTAFRIGRNLKTINVELELYDKQRVELAKKFGTLDEAKQQYKFENGSGEKFVEELNAMLATEIEIAVTPILLTDLDDVKISAANMAALDWLIEDAAISS